MQESMREIYNKLESGFFGFWVARWKFTALFSLLLIGIGLYSAFIIPKESAPDIQFGIIQVTTIYPGVNPQDMDTLITEKIEQALDNIDGIKKITSNSAIGLASTTVELDNDVDTSKVLVEIKDAVDKVSLPSDAEDPIVTEISTDNERMFQVLLYGDTSMFTPAYIQESARSIKSTLEGQGAVSRIDIDQSGAFGPRPISAGGSADAQYQVRVTIDRDKAEQLGLSLRDIASAIRANNNNQPLGTHRIDTLNYTLRIQGELDNEQSLVDVPILTSRGTILLGNIATVSRHYDDSKTKKLGSYQASGYYFSTMTFNKKPGTNVFSSSDKAKEALEKLLETQAYQGLGIFYTQDLADIIRDDYQSLATNGLQTIFFVFFAILLFVGLKESIIASITIPLAFLITFVVLNQLGLSLNFLTNFSLIICFGIAIDTTIVVIEGAHEKMRLGFDPKSAVLLAVKEYKWPLIAGTATTCVVFLPLLSLPGVTGKFLAYIPITIFTTLLAALFISLTINSALYYKLSKKNTFYQKRDDEQQYLSDEELTLLAIERSGKEEKTTETFSRRERILDGLNKKYGGWLAKIMDSKKSRLTAILGPVLLLILSFVFLSSRLGFEFFPSGDNPFINIQILGQEGVVTDVMRTYTDHIDTALSVIPEIKVYSYTVAGNSISLTVELLKKDERKRNSFQVESQIDQLLQPLRSQGLTISTQVLRGGPPTGRAVGVKLTAQRNDDFDTLLTVADDFEAYLKKIDGVRNVSNSSSQSPGQFIFRLDKQKLALMGVLPNEISSELFLALNGMTAGTVRGYYDNHDISLVYDNFVDGVSPSDVIQMRIPTRAGIITLGSVAEYSFERAINNISRENGNITVRVEADMDPGLTPDVAQSTFVAFAKDYRFPDGISFQEGGETQENADVIQATGVAFVIAIVLIYAILILQFNSFLQPFIIMYSIVMGLLGSNIGLWVTGNPYSMAFGIGFIALTGIVVNDAIVFIDRANNNIKRGLSRYDAIVETGKARLQPIILTTITTVLGLSSVARQDEFFAGLAYTIMFGLAVASAMTLFVIPALYYDTDKIIHNIKRSLVAGAVFMGMPIGAILAIYVIALMFNLGVITSNIGAVFGGLFVVYIIAYIVYAIQSHTTQEPNIIEKTIGLQVVQDDGTPLSRNLAIKRFGYKWGSILIPTILGSIVNPGLGILLLFVVLGINFVHVWLDDDNKAWYDRWTKTKTINL